MLTAHDFDTIRPLPLLTTVRELQLRAQQPGALLIGPVRARQGVSVVSTDPILVTVDSAADRAGASLSPLARALLAFEHGKYAATIDLLRPLRNIAQRFGGR